jgi:predicted oxidoreductase
MVQEGIDDVDHADLYSEDEARAYIAAHRVKP